MNEYIVTNKTFVKTNNKSSSIINRYFYSLIAFIILELIIYLIFHKTELVITEIKTLALSFVTSAAIKGLSFL